MLLRQARGWLGVLLAVVVLGTGAALGAQAAPASGEPDQAAALSVSVVATNQINPQIALPAAQTSSDPATVQAVVTLLNALKPPTGGIRHCPMDDGTLVHITLPGYAQADVHATGCGTVMLTRPGQGPRILDGGRELVVRVYALFGVTWRG